MNWYRDKTLYSISHFLSSLGGYSQKMIKDFMITHKGTKNQLLKQ